MNGLVDPVMPASKSDWSTGKSEKVNTVIVANNLTSSRRCPPAAR